ncbi:MAG TPA: transposase, partial [Methanotrichaceae archaeon]|nr:transposase [Methanotrichaceae archaeon]
MISYKYPIFPDKATQQKLAEALDACRWLYNKLLQEINEARARGIKLTKYETQNMIPSLKLENPKLNLVYSKALQMVNYTLHSNIASLAALKRNGYEVGPLRFKGYGWYKTLNYNQSGFKIDQDHGRLHLSKIGDIRIKLYRKIEGCIKAIIIKREGRQWFAIVQANATTSSVAASMESRHLEPEPLPETGKSVGLDVGLMSFVVDSDSNSVENPKYADKSANELAKAQRRLARAE